MCDSHLTGESFVGAANVLHYLLRKEHKMQIIPLCAKEFVSFGMSEIKLKLSKFRTEKKERKRKYATFTEEFGSDNKYRINLTNRLTFGNNISHFFHFFGRRNFFPKKVMTLPLLAPLSAGIKVI